MTTSARGLSAFWLKVLISGAAVYVAAFVLLALGDPLFLAPQLDGAENLELARGLRDGILPDGPFYRALLYPLILSLMVPEAGAPVAALLLGVVLHLLNAGLVWRLSHQLTGLPVAALLAGIAYAIYPPSLFASMELLDGTMAISAFLGGIALIMGRKHPQDVGWWHYALSGLLLGLAVLARPHFLPVAMVIPFIFAWIWPRGGLRALSALAATALCLGVQTGLNYAHSGEVRILPWQGAYNLWAANRPGANGLYLQQVVDVSRRGDLSNPTMAESVELYARAHPDEQAPYAVANMNAHWRTQLREAVLADPQRLLRLWLFKGYAILNTFEQYNNLTFQFHKERLPLLRYNPLSWGILLVSAVLGFSILVRRQPRIALALFLMAAAYSISLFLYYVSGRFRLPLAPLLVISASAAATYVLSFASFSKRFRVLSVGAALLTAVVTFSWFGGIRSTATYIQDKLLMANANADLMRDAQAADWAREVMIEQPNRFEAQRIYAVSYFNLAITSDPARRQFGDWEDQRAWITLAPPTDPTMDAILGFYYWNWGDRDRAVLLWRSLAAQQPGPLPQAALRMADPNTPASSPTDSAVRDLLHP